MDIGEAERASLVQAFPHTPAAKQLQQELRHEPFRGEGGGGGGAGGGRRGASPRRDADVGARSRRGKGASGGAGEGGGKGRGGGQMEYATGFWVQFRLLFRRSWLHARRNPVSGRAAMSRSVTMGLSVCVCVCLCVCVCECVCVCIYI
jgi:hypothetical protein